MKECTEKGGQIAVMVGTSPFVKVHNRSLAMEMIRANAAILNLKPVEDLPDAGENVSLMVDERVIDCCLERFNEEYAKTYGKQERTGFICDQHSMPE